MAFHLQNDSDFDVIIAVLIFTQNASPVDAINAYSVSMLAYCLHSKTVNYSTRLTVVKVLSLTAK